VNRHLSALLKHPDPEVRDHARALAPKGRRTAKPKAESVAFAERRRAEDEEREDARKAAEYGAVLDRAGDACELTGARGTDLDPLVIHHIVYGQGVDRDAVTWAELMVRVRESIHRAIHRDPTRWAVELKVWARGHGYTRAWTEVARRCAKAAEARAAARAERERSGA
jgi:hypothetical protein